MSDASLRPVSARSMANRAFVAVALMIGFYALAVGIAAALLAIAWFLVAGSEHLRVNYASGKLALVCAIGGGTILWSILPRIDRFDPPGPRLSPADDPRLFEHVRKIAAATRQPLPTEVYLVPDVNAWVSRRGGIMGFFSRPVLGLGLPLLATLSVSELEAVLAHEFGHFHGGETRLGPWIYKTRAAIGRTIENLARHRRSYLRGPFLWYGNLFLRITHAISRKQELAADALAARVVDPGSLARGLERIGAASMVYGTYLQSEIGPTLSAGYRAPMAHGFQLFLMNPRIATQLGEAIETRKREEVQNPYDTHPPLRERIDALRSQPDSPHRVDARPAIELLDRVDSLETELMRFMVRGVDPAKLPALDWSTAPQKVWIPNWEESRRRAAAELAGIRVIGLPGVVCEPPKRGSQTSEVAETRQRKIGLYGAALALALHEQGWILSAEVGEEFSFSKGGLEIRPFEVMRDLSDGRLSAEAWQSRCREAGLEDLLIAPPPAEIPPSA